ncbi:MAG: hypothetical protein J5626_02455 [Lachnospiraceae bacterium]|nr:hypothetical protein [Lachnospiraceae bacterium]
MTKKYKVHTQEEWAKSLLIPAKERMELLNDTVNKLEADLATAPEGMLRDVRHREGYQYYWRKNSTDRSGSYISKSDVKTISALADKEYQERFLQAAKSEIKSLENYVSEVNGNPLESVYAKMREARKPFVSPVIIPEDIYTKEWESKDYEPGYFAPGYPEYYSAKDERVRSKAEENIANLLKMNNVPYHYEFPMQIGSEERRPDFLCLNVRSKKEYLWEHFGMMDNPDYAQKNVDKINKMAANGYIHGQNCIFTFETSILPLNTRIIQLMIDTFLK